LDVTVGAACLVNEFHDPESHFHQVEIFFRCQISAGEIHDDWQDPERIVTKRHFFTQTELEKIRYRPLSLSKVAFSSGLSLNYDAFEPIVY